MEVRPNGSLQVITSTFLTPIATVDPFLEVELNKTKIAEEFYATYDVMTGIRIAVTLGGFFAFVVLLVLVKSKSKTERALEDPDFTAAAVAEVEEEEERQFAAALEATIYQKLGRRSRQSLDTNMSQSWIRHATRFSSIGGYNSIIDPPIRIASRLPSFIDEDSPEEERSIFNDVILNRQFEDPRRPSNITCSSSGSSYLERRDSAVVLGFPAVPGHKTRTSRQRQSPLMETYDFYYPIDIRVIQPTPGGSPCGSERAIYDNVVEPGNLKPRLAPLASISSCNSSLETDYPEIEVHSYGSENIFNDSDDDTDIEVAEFSTDSEEACCSKSKRECKTFRLRGNLKSSSTIRNMSMEVPEILYPADEDIENISQETLF